MFVQKWQQFAADVIGERSFERSRFLVDKCQPYLTGNKFLDLGSGSGHTAVVLQQYGHHATMLDVKPHSGAVGDWLLRHPCAAHISRSYDIPYCYYNGDTIPFADNSFDYVLIAFVLHHCPAPARVLGEASRVARKRLFVFEDVTESTGKKIVDSMINWEVASPHSNLSRANWLSLFDAKGLRLVAEDNWNYQVGPISLPNTLFVLDKV